MIVYAESSAVLAWILGEPSGEAVRMTLRSARRVVSSALTEVECARALARGAAGGRLSAADALAARRVLDRAVATWATLDLSERVLSRARDPFPREPIRTLDALHLSSALLFRDALPSLVIASLDERVRDNAVALGIAVTP